jgi:hypothetical protein
MLVEVAAYGFAVLKVWPNLKGDWVEIMRSYEGSPSHFPVKLERLCLVGVAPDEYWSRCLGSISGTKEGKFPPEAWPNFWKLVDAFGKWFDIHFVAVEGSWDNDDKLPNVNRARAIDLRSASLKSDRGGGLI